MIKYDGQLKRAELHLKKKRKGRKKKTVKYCTDILTFDIEVTSAWMDGDELIPYRPGLDADYWNDKDKYALPYIWQFSFNDQVYYGRNLYEFKRVLRDLKENVLYIIWVHNLAYEFVFLLNLFTVEKTFARSPHEPMYVIFKEFPNIRFQCSYVLTNLSLASWGDQLGIPKLVGDLDYLKMRTPLTELTEKEMEYCERDCQVVFAGISDHLKMYEDVFDIPMTSTGKVRRPVKEIVTKDREYMRDMHKMVPASVHEYELFQTVSAGGYTHGNRKYLGKTIREPVMGHSDISSSYPFQMMLKVPYNKWCYYGKDLPDPETFEYRAYIIKLHMKGVQVKTWNTYISRSKCIGSGLLEDNGRILKADELYITCTEKDYLTIIETYDYKEIESLGTYVCYKRYLPTILVDFILDLYEKKTSLKNVPEREEEYAISKQYVNAIFGMMLTNPAMADVILTEDNEWKVQDLTYDKIEYILNKKRRWFDKSYFVNYATGAWITAGARRSLWTAILHGDMDNRLLYTDTDSLFYIGEEDFTYYNDHVDALLREACEYHGFDFERTRPKDIKGIPHPLGHMEIEHPDEKLEAFKTLGAKKYIEQRDGRLYLTVSGVNKSAVSCLKSIDDFDSGFEFDKDAKDMKKNQHTYLDNMQTVIYPDGFVSDLKYGINMRPTGYRLSVPKVYDVLDLCDAFIEDVKNPSRTKIIADRGRRKHG